MTLTEEILTQLPGDALGNLRRADSLWQAIRTGGLPIPQVVTVDSALLDSTDWDVVICGGTLGIMLAAALAQRGWRVALIERGILQGRVQEWNISRQELRVFLELNLLSADELPPAIASTYNPGRISFLGGEDIWVRDVLNIGVDPQYLLAILKAKFLAAGGYLLENTVFEGITVHPNGVEIALGQNSAIKTTLTARLAIDAMGHFSPIVQQARQGQKPDGICLVVGTCAQGFPRNETGDLLVSFTPITNQCQYFWEAFPARDGRTTYLFTYVDAHPDRFSLETLLEEYFRLLPSYQNVQLHQLKFQRALFGCFPSYQKSPFRFPWQRILAVGDSSGSQSPVSFGGFGAMVRHLGRLTEGISAALASDTLSQPALGLLQPYQPNIAVTWMFQKAMSIPMNKHLPPEHINQLLARVFQAMSQLGDRALLPFLQDVVQFSALSQTLWQVSLTQPLLAAQILPHVGMGTLVNWLVHYINLGAYTVLHPLGKLGWPASKFLSPEQQYYCDRLVQAWKYGSGSDYIGRFEEFKS
jgi:lycopene cyclase CruP